MPLSSLLSVMNEAGERRSGGKGPESNSVDAPTFAHTVGQLRYWCGRYVDNRWSMLRHVCPFQFKTDERITLGTGSQGALGLPPALKRLSSCLMRVRNDTGPALY